MTNHKYLSHSCYKKKKRHWNRRGITLSFFPFSAKCSKNPHAKLWEDKMKVLTSHRWCSWIPEWPRGDSRPANICYKCQNALKRYFDAVWRDNTSAKLDFYLESRTKPEGHDHVSIHLGPHVQHGHDQRDHQELRGEDGNDTFFLNDYICISVRGTHGLVFRQLHRRMRLWNV